MFKINDEASLKNSFRPSERDAIELPAHFKFPILVRDTLTWQDSSGTRSYLVVNEPGSEKTLGVAFRSNYSAPVTINHCEWCHSEGGSSQIALLLANASDRKTVGVHLCRDLACETRIETRAQLSGENSRLLAKELTARKLAFVRRYLF